MVSEARNNIINCNIIYLYNASGDWYFNCREVIIKMTKYDRFISHNYLEEDEK